MLLNLRITGSLGEDLERYINIWLVLNDDNMVHGTYHPSLTRGSFIIDKTHVQYV